MRTNGRRLDSLVVVAAKRRQEILVPSGIEGRRPSKNFLPESAPSASCSRGKAARDVTAGLTGPNPFRDQRI
jgi:hypothetical protein